MEERSRRFGRVAAVCACALAFAGAGSAQAADWQLQAHLPGESFRPNLPLLGVSCTSKAFCVVVGEVDTVASSADPTGGQSKWDVVQPEGEAQSDCHAHWDPPCQDPKGRAIRGVSCPSAQLCVAVTSEGYVYSSTDPTGSGADWDVADVDGTGRDIHLMAVSCPSTSLCVAVSGQRYLNGKVLWSTSPTGGAQAWHEAQLDETLELTGVSCGTPSFCVAVAENGRLLVSTNPTGGAGAWREVGSSPGGPGDLQGVSCVGEALCVAGNAGGNLLTSTNPLGAASGWEEVDGGSSVQITDVSCLPSRQCAAVDNNGDVLTTDDPTAGRGSWSLANLIPYTDPPNEHEQPLNALFGVSCTSSSLCALSGADGRIYTSGDPFVAPTGGNGTAPGTRKGGRRPRRPRVKIASMHGGYPLRSRHAKARVYFRFHATGRVRRFLCERDHGPFRRCHSPLHYRVGIGKHAFRVRAIGMTGLPGPIATKQFEIQLKPTLIPAP